MRTNLSILCVSLIILSGCNNALPPPETGTDHSSSRSMNQDMSSSYHAASSVTSSRAQAPSSVTSSRAEKSSASSAISSHKAQASSKPSASVRVIEVSAADWQFTPSTINVKKGEKVIIRLKGVEGMHSFAIPSLGINVSIDPGETKDVEIPTDTAGTFAFRCTIPCGPGHRDMTGTLVVS